MKEALFYGKLEGKKLKCGLCARGCIISEGKTGFCNVRKNIDGKLFSLVYGKLCSVAVDPIEKKPLYHFLPGSTALSIATVGCNLRCRFCQNFEIAQVREIFGGETSPKEIVKLAKENKTKSIAYTYTEPTIFYEFALDTMKIAKKEGIKNVWVSNGYITKKPIRKMAKLLDAVNVDIKGDEKVYNELCLASLKPVKESLIEFRKNKIWIEITCLIIPGKNDSAKWMDEITIWIRDNLGRETPLHLSRFFPMHEMKDTEPTPMEILKELHAVARNNLDYAYIGNVPRGKEHNTFCPSCGELAIEREGYFAKSKGRKCRKCGKIIAGVFD